LKKLKKFAKQKLTSIGIVVILVMSSVFAFIGERYLSLIDETNANNKYLADLVHELDTNIFDIARNSLTSAAELPYLVEIATGSRKIDDAEALAAMYQVKNYLGSFFVYLIDEKGQTVASTLYGGGKSLKGKNYAFRPYFKVPMQTRKAAIYQALGVTTNKRGIYISVPVFSKLHDKVVGVLATKFGLDTLDVALQGTQTPTVLVSPEGIVFASNRPEWMYKSLYPLDIEQRQKLIKSKQFGANPLENAGIILTRNSTSVVINGDKYLISSRPVMDNGWHLLHFYQPAKLDLLQFALIFLLLFFFFTGIYTIVHFYSGKRSTEKRFRTLFEKSPVAYLLLDGEAFIDCNQSALDMLYSNRLAVLHKQPAELSPEFQPDGTSSKKLMKDYIAESFEQGMARFEWVLQRADGIDFYVDVTLTPLEVDDRTIIFTSWHDIQEQKQAEKDREAYLLELQEALKVADKASKAKSEFLSRMSHELRTPMNAILGFSQLISMTEKLSEDARDSLSEIINAGNHLLALINEVLDLSRIESGKFKVDVEPVELEWIIEECVSLVVTLAKERGVVIESNLNTNYQVIADPRRLKQVFINLLSNGIKYNKPEGRVKIYANESPEPGFIRITVSDTGHGIDDEKLDQLFQPFERLDYAESQIEGTGIGLTITLHLVELMQGRLGVSSELNVGSLFWIDLPVAKKQS